jgi:hypothetical protein
MHSRICYIANYCHILFKFKIDFLIYNYILKKMIATQQIKSVSDTPKQYKNFIIINVLRWNNNKYKQFSPYFLKTDGNEENKNKLRAK